MSNTDLITIEPDNIPAMLENDDGMKAVVERIREAARSEPSDISTAAGRKIVKSTAYLVACTKSPLKAVADTKTAEAKALIKGITSRVRRFEEAMDDLRDEIRNPLSQWEQVEEDRKAKIKETIEAVEDLLAAKSSEGIQVQIDKLTETEFAKDEFKEFLGLAFEAKENTLKRLAELKSVALDREEADRKAEEERAELAKLRADREVADKKAAKEKAAADAKQAELEKELADQKAATARAEEDAANTKREAARGIMAATAAEQVPEEGAEVAGDEEEKADTAPASSSPVTDPRQQAIDMFHALGFPEKSAETILAHIVAGRIPYVTFNATEAT